MPEPKKLVDWYKKMLDKGKSDSVVYEYRVSPMHSYLLHNTVIISLAA